MLHDISHNMSLIRIVAIFQSEKNNKFGRLNSNNPKLNTWIETYWFNTDHKIDINCNNAHVLWLHAHTQSTQILIHSLQKQNQSLPLICTKISSKSSVVNLLHKAKLACPIFEASYVRFVLKLINHSFNFQYSFYQHMSGMRNKHWRKNGVTLV